MLEFYNSTWIKKVLIVNDNVNHFKNKYNKELFKECEFLYLHRKSKLPMTKIFLDVMYGSILYEFNIKCNIILCYIDFIYFIINIAYFYY